MDAGDHLETLNDIRSLMTRSSRFLSLSGLSGVFSGIFALSGALAAYAFLNLDFSSSDYYKRALDSLGNPDISFFTFFIFDATAVLLLSFSSGFFFTYRYSVRSGVKVWDAAAKKLIINLLIPLFAGGFFCVVLVYHRQVGLIPPAMLLFYGLALINASKYTLDDIRYLGFIEVVLGLVSAFFIGYGLLFWAFGFGVMHIIYGIVMYNKYER